MIFFLANEIIKCNTGYHNLSSRNLDFMFNCFKSNRKIIKGVVIVLKLNSFNSINCVKLTDRAAV